MSATKVNIFNLPFKLHYKLTSSILVAFSLVLIFYTIFRPGTINCVTESTTWPVDYLKSLCLDSLSSTSRLTNAPPAIEKTTEKTEEDLIYQGFYPYVWLFLLCQAASFMVPYLLWKAIEGGKSMRLAAVLGNPNIPDRDSKLKRVSGYIGNNFRTNDVYTFGLFTCELLNFVNAVVQINVLNWFIRGQGDSASPLMDLFPSAVKCTFHRIGPSGVPQRHAASCILPTNILHSKMVAFLLYWFIILAIVSALVLLYRLVWLCSQRLRYVLLLQHYRSASSHNLLDANLQKFGIGDYYLMRVVLEHTHPVNLQDFLNLLHGHKAEFSSPSGDGVEMYARNNALA